MLFDLLLQPLHLSFQKADALLERRAHSQRQTGCTQPILLLHHKLLNTVQTPH